MFKDFGFCWVFLLFGVFIFSIKVRVAVIYFDKAISKIKIPENQI